MRALLYETRTGHPIRDLERSGWDYDTGILAPDKLTVTVPAYTHAGSVLDLRGLLTPWKHSIALIDESVEGERVVKAAGPISARPVDDSTDGKHGFKVTCHGVETLLQFRHIRLFPGWPLLNAQGIPTGTYDQQFQDLSYGTIIKQLVAESEKFPGGDLPIVYEADRAGIHERTSYEAVDGKPVLEAMDQIADLNDGIEWDFETVIDEHDQITHRLHTATDADRVLVPHDHMVWNAGGPAPDIRGWDPVDLLDEVATDAIYAGGKDQDKILLARASDSTLIDDGWPRIERWDSSHSTVSVQSTLQKWADGRLGGLVQRFGFEVRADRARPLRHGDRVTLAADGHWDIANGPHELRVLSVAQDSGSPDWVTVQTF